MKIPPTSPTHALRGHASNRALYPFTRSGWPSGLSRATALYCDFDSEVSAQRELAHMLYEVGLPSYVRTAALSPFCAVASVVGRASEIASCKRPCLHKGAVGLMRMPAPTTVGLRLRSTRLLSPDRFPILESPSEKFAVQDTLAHPTGQNQELSRPGSPWSCSRRWGLLFGRGPTSTDGLGQSAEPSR